MAGKRVPLELGLIDEGRFIIDANEDLSQLQQDLMAYRRLHGDDSKGAKAKLTVEVTICIDDPKNELFSIKAVSKRTLPARPAATSLAIVDIDEASGQECLTVKPSGSDATSPRQGKLATDDGWGIDQDTGKADPEKTLQLPPRTGTA